MAQSELHDSLNLSNGAEEQEVLSELSSIRERDSPLYSSIQSRLPHRNFSSYQPANISGVGRNLQNNHAGMADTNQYYDNYVGGIGDSQENMRPSSYLINLPRDPITRLSNYRTANFNSPPPNLRNVPANHIVASNVTTYDRAYPEPFPAPQPQRSVGHTPGLSSDNRNNSIALEQQAPQRDESYHLRSFLLEESKEKSNKIKSLEIAQEKYKQQIKFLKDELHRVCNERQDEVSRLEHELRKSKKELNDFKTSSIDAQEKLLKKLFEKILDRFKKEIKDMKECRSVKGFPDVFEEHFEDLKFKKKAYKKLEKEIDVAIQAERKKCSNVNDLSFLLDDILIELPARPNIYLPPGSGFVDIGDVQRMLNLSAPVSSNQQHLPITENQGVRAIEAAPSATNMADQARVHTPPVYVDQNRPSSPDVAPTLSTSSTSSASSHKLTQSNKEGGALINNPFARMMMRHNLPRPQLRELIKNFMTENNLSSIKNVPEETIDSYIVAHTNNQFVPNHPVPVAQNDSETTVDIKSLIRYTHQNLSEYDIENIIRDILEGDPSGRGWPPTTKLEQSEFMSKFNSKAINIYSSGPRVHRALSEESDRCSICQDILGNAEVDRLICKHVFHKKCIEQSLSYDPRCPICRELILDYNEFPPLAKD